VAKKVAQLYPSADHGLEFHFNNEYQLSFVLTKAKRCRDIEALYVMSGNQRSPQEK